MKRTPTHFWAGVLLLVTFLTSAPATGATGDGVATVDDGLLTVDSSGMVVITCASGQVKVNGADPESGPYACADLTGIVVNGSPAGDEISLAGVTAAAFTNLASVYVAGHAGDDRIIASELADTLEGGSGDDTFSGTDGADEVDGGTGQTYFVEQTELREVVAIETPAGNPGPTLPPAAPLAPGLDTTFAGITLETHNTNFNIAFIPPDPMAAAGPDHVVSVVNTAIEWYAKDGTLQSSQLLATFFSSLSPATNTFDPKVIYDQFEDRFVVVTLERTSTPQTSFIMLAVSDDSDPNGAWYFHKINAELNIGGSDTFADYPGFAIDEQAVYVTANMFTFAGSNVGARLWIVDKGTAGGFYAGGPASANVYDPPGAVGQAFTTMQPAHIFGVAPAGVGTWLARYSGYSGGGTESLSLIRVDDPLGTPAFSHQFVALGNIDNTALAMPDAPQQSGAQAIDTGDRRLLHAVWRDDELWAMMTVVPVSGSDGGQATAHWVKVNTFDINSLALSDQGNAGAEDIAADTYTFWGSIAVDPCGNMAMTFAGSGDSIHPGAYYTGRLASDPPGTVDSTGTLAAGTASYALIDSSGRNRWGDYSGSALDPADEAHFWFFHERAIPPSIFSSQWATQFGSFSFNDTGFDFGDLPGGYGLDQRADDGARHCPDGITLGEIWDADPDGQANSGATGDDDDGTDDEDGVVVANAPWSNGPNGASAQVTIGGSGNGCLSGWLDWNEDLDFGDPDEQIIVNDAVTAGSSSIFTFDVPDGVFGGSGRAFNARFRLVPDKDGDASCADQTAPSLTGTAGGGEVEDYQWFFSPTAITLRNIEARAATVSPLWLLAALLLLGIMSLLVRRARHV
jgi:hypothetical protein